jgi:uncharacterized cupin superfamily protein
MKRANIADPKFEFDAEDPEGFRAGHFSLRKLFEAKDTGMGVYELAPGQSNCPYHYEVGEEEWLLVLEGRPTVRHPEGSEDLGPYDVAFFPRGPEGAHRIENNTDAPVRFLMFSNVVAPTATVYPDSDKVGVWAGDPETDQLFKRDSAVDYYDGEAPEA